MEHKILDDDIMILTGEYRNLNLSELAAGREIVELDMGCGKGSFTTELAKRYPDRLILAADVMIGRLRKLVSRCRREEIQNIVALRVEARMLISVMLPDHALDRLHILCPDPWPKGRHRGNRLLAADFLAQIHRVLKKNGHWHFSTDDLNYLNQVRNVVASSGLFEEKPELLDDIVDIKSDFECRWNEEGKQVYHHLWRPLPIVWNGIGH